MLKRGTLELDPSSLASRFFYVSLGFKLGSFSGKSAAGVAFLSFPFF